MRREKDPKESKKTRAAVVSVLSGLKGAFIVRVFCRIDSTHVLGMKCAAKNVNRHYTVQSVSSFPSFPISPISISVSLLSVCLSVCLSLSLSLSSIPSFSLHLPRLPFILLLLHLSLSPSVSLSFFHISFSIRPFFFFSPIPFLSPFFYLVSSRHPLSLSFHFSLRSSPHPILSPTFSLTFPRQFSFLISLSLSLSLSSYISPKILSFALLFLLSLSYSFFRSSGFFYATFSLHLLTSNIYIYLSLLSTAPLSSSSSLYCDHFRLREAI
ncbi:unnamed protein product [Acanthosepion pharaonis]|uniref:Uncharacterized protein n=1 Tax=Acanthosepion pharaonis TaxID=158019 RepID=A0A812DMD8_ACAPH|nr:unnamed protein product [Sepia pharaonis]